MKKKIIGITALVLVAGFALWAFGAPLWQQAQHKKQVNIYRVDLSGTAPTETQLTAQGVTSGDLVMDTSDETLYIVDNPDGPFLTKISAAGVLTATNVVMSGGLTADGDITLENNEVIDNGTAGTVNLITTRTNLNPLNFYLTSSMATGAVADGNNAIIGYKEYNQAPTPTNTLYSSWRFYVDDVTKASEDGSLRGYAYIAGTDSEVVRISAKGLIVTNSGGDLYVRDDLFITDDATIGGDLAAGTLAGNGSGVTNLSASNLASGTVPNARLDADLQALAINNGAAVTNLSASNLASGTVPNARLDTDLQALAINNGGSLTNLNGANLQAASVGAAALSPTITNAWVAGMDAPAVNGAAITNLTAANIASGGAITAINGAAITNLAAGNLASGTVPNGRLDTQLQTWAGLGVDYGTCTGGQTVAYSAVYSATPRISLTWAENPTATNVLYLVSRNTTNFVCNGNGAKAIDYIVIGTR